MTCYQKELVLAERTQHLEQLMVYSELAKLNTGWFGNRIIKKNAMLVIKGLMYKVSILDDILANNFDNPLR